MRFVDGNGIEVKNVDTSREDLSGTAISSLALITDQTTFYNDGDIANNNTEEFAAATNKYVYKSVSAVNSSDEDITVLEAGAIVTIVYDKYAKRTYTVKAVDDKETVLEEIAAGYVYTDNISVTVNTPWYVLYNNTLYNLNGNSTTFNVERNSYVKTLEYTITDKTNVVFYSEGEDLAGVTKVTNSIASKKGIARIPNETTYTNLGAGSYTVYVRAHSGNSSGGTAFFKVGDVTFAQKSFAGGTNNQDFNGSVAIVRG